ncbi:hypothetical protein ACMFMG_011143 [Clarireedia jacksonii]
MPLEARSKTVSSMAVYAYHGSSGEHLWTPTCHVRRHHPLITLNPYHNHNHPPVRNLRRQIACPPKAEIADGLCIAELPSALAKVWRAEVKRIIKRTKYHVPKNEGYKSDM